MISCYLLLTDVVIDPDVGSEDTEMLGEGRASATENKNTMSYHVYISNTFFNIFTIHGIQIKS